MSYCVNCGVELAETERSCPLCDTPVVNPVSPWKEPETKPYPERMDTVMKKIDYKFGVRLASLLLILPAAVTVLCNFAVNHSLSWSLYVVGALACLFVYVLLPLLYKRQRPYLYLVSNAAASAIYVALIAWLNDGFKWYFELAVPIMALTFAATMIMAFIYRKRTVAPLHKAASTSLCIGVLTVGIETAIDLFVFEVAVFHWSLYVLIVGAVFAAAFALLQSKKDWQEEIRKRLFY